MPLSACFPLLVVIPSTVYCQYQVPFFPTLSRLFSLSLWNNQNTSIAFVRSTISANYTLFRPQHGADTFESLKLCRMKSTNGCERLPSRSVHQHRDALTHLWPRKDPSKRTTVRMLGDLTNEGAQRYVLSYYHPRRLETQERRPAASHPLLKRKTQREVQVTAKCVCQNIKRRCSANTVLFQ